MKSDPRTPLVAALCVACAFPLAAELPPASPAQVVAMVNGEAVLTSDIERSLRRLHGSAEVLRRQQFDLDRLMTQVVNDVLIAQEARSLGMHEEPPVPEKVESFRRSMALAKLEREEIEGQSEPTAAEVEALFQDQYRRATFRIATSYDRSGAEQLLEALDGGSDFAALAQERSVDPYRLRGGLVERIARVDLRNEVGDLVFTLDVGQLAGPVRTDLGWSLVRVEAFEAADRERFDALQAKLEALVRQRKASELRQALAGEIGQRHAVVVDEEVVRSITPEPMADGRFQPRLEDPDLVAVRVGEAETITAEEYATAVRRRWRSIRNEEAARAAAPIVLGRLIEERLLLVEALARGYAELPGIRRAVHAHETQLLVPRFLEQVLAAEVEVSEEEKSAYYTEHRQEYHRPPLVRLGQITVTSREEAERIAGLLRVGGDLAWLAREHSQDGFKDSGGDRGWYEPRPGIEGFDEQLFTAGVGDVLEPFGEQTTWLVLKVTDRKEQGVYPLERVSGNVRDALFKIKFREVLDDFLGILRNRSDIEIREDRLAALRITGIREDEEHGDGGHGR